VYLKITIQHHKGKVKKLMPKLSPSHDPDTRTDKIMSRYFSVICSYLAQGKALSPQVLLFRLLCILLILLCVILIIPSNILQGSPASLNIVVLVYAVIMMFIFYDSLDGNNYYKTMYFLTMLLFNICWFLKGGSTGGTRFLFLTAAIFPFVLFRGAQRMLILLPIVLNYTVLIYLERRYPSLVVPFVSTNARYLDLLTGFAASICITVHIVVLIYDSKLGVFLHDTKLHPP